MNGRFEHEQSVLKKLQEQLDNAPEYMKAYYYSLNGKSYTTKKSYIRHILCFLNYIQEYYTLDINDENIFKQVKPSMINRYIHDCDHVGNSAKATKIYALQHFFQYLVNDDVITTNPCVKIDKPKDNVVHEIVALTPQEIDEVQESILAQRAKYKRTSKTYIWLTRDYAIIVLALALGLRVTSISEIDIDDIDLDDNKIKIVEKGNRVREIDFSDHLKNILLEWMLLREQIVSPHLHVVRSLFISNRKIRIAPRTIFDIVQKHTACIDKHITPHKLRSTCATNVYNATGDIYVTAEILGHSNIRNTMRYAKVSEERKKQAVKAMDDILF